LPIYFDNDDDGRYDQHQESVVLDPVEHSSVAALHRQHHSTHTTSTSTLTVYTTCS